MKRGVAKSVFGSFGAAIVKVKVVLPSESHAAMDLNAAIADGASGVAGIHFGDRNSDGGVRSVFFESPSGIVNSGTGTLGFEIHIGALMLYGLEHADRFAELFARFGIF